MSGLRISARLRLTYLTSLFKQPVSIIDSTSPGKIASRLTTNANVIQMGISQQLSQLVQAIALTLGLYVTSFIKGPLLTLVASASLPLTLILYSVCIPFVFKNQKKGEKFKEQASALAFEIFESIRIVAAFGAEKRLEEKHSSFILKARESERANGPWMGMLMAPMFFSVYATFSLTFWFGIKEVTHGHLDGIASITVVLFSVNFAATGLGRLVGPIIGMIRAATAASEIFAAIDNPAPDMTGLKDPDVSPKDDIEFRNIDFIYPTRKETQVLNKLNVRFEQGKTTAIVGPSGSGKSTIVGLIQRWYEPTLVTSEKDSEVPKPEDIGSTKDSEKDKGSDDIAESTDQYAVDEKKSSGIFIGDVNLKEVDAKWWRKQVGLVQQEPFLFNDTIYNNVANGLSGTPWEDLPKDEQFAMVQNACKEAFADDFISRLPEVSCGSIFVWRVF
jgi:ATP-binding cassette, subfamily B (MDR/TAP), member 1